MLYVSTRGSAAGTDFRGAVLSGLAGDGGLYVPRRIPSFTQEQIASWSWLPFDELVWRVVSPFVADSIDETALRALLSNSYRGFGHRAIIPLQQVGHNEWILQLFHGPTRSSKDFAAQLQARLVAHFLERQAQPLLFVGATNGDTGLAAAQALIHCPQAQLVLLYPRDGVSAEQRAALQVLDPQRVTALAVDGTFDDCQTLVSRLLRDWPLAGVTPVCFNSTNWVGVLAQIVYYFHAALQLGGGTRPVCFSVPAASFAEIYAGFIAQKMGLPINQIIVSTNRNDALHQFIQRNRYSTRVSDRTLAPAMDFSLFSNLERLVWELYEHDGETVRALMEQFEANGELSIANTAWLQARILFDSYAVDEAQLRDEIGMLLRETGSAVDPQTALGLLAGRLHRRNLGAPTVTLGQRDPCGSAWLPGQAVAGSQPAAVLSAGDLQGLQHLLVQAWQACS